MIETRDLRIEHRTMFTGRREVPECGVEPEAIDLEELLGRSEAHRAEYHARDEALAHVEVADDFVCRQVAQHLRLREEVPRELGEHLPEQERPLEVHRLAEARRRVGAAT